MYMIRSKILLAAFACIFLAGQIPYGYLYCTMMKQRLDAQMLQCCPAHRPGAAAAVSCPAEFRIRHIDKNTTDRSDHRPHTLPGRGQVLEDATDCAALGLHGIVLRSYNLPPPDIVVGQHNLRI